MGIRNVCLFFERDWYLNCEKINKFCLEDIMVVDLKLLIFFGGLMVINYDWERWVNKKMIGVKLKDF